MRLARYAAVAATLLLGACASAGRAPTAPGGPAGPAAPRVGLPPIPAAEGPLAIRVVHPTPNAPRPNVDSTYIYGSVGTGRATLTINGVEVPVAPNGAFLAYLPVPPAGAAYELAAQAGGRTVTAAQAYRAPAPPPATPARGPTTVEFPAPRAATVSGGADTLATGSDVVVGRPTPTGTYRWFLPRGARVSVTGERADQYRVRLDGATEAWIDADELALGDTAAAPAPAPAPVTLGVDAAPGWVDVRFAAGWAPFQVQAERDRLVLTLHGRTAAAVGPKPASDPLVGGIGWQAAAPDQARAEILLSRPLWGYKAFYSPEGDLVVRLRRPPAIDPAQPLRGRRIVIDPGHPPSGATGPTGLTEAEANLAIGLRLAAQLRARGAEVILTRTDNSPLDLGPRVQLAVRTDAELLVSVHNNAFGEGVNPFRNHGSSTYYFHPFAAELARALDREIAATTLIPDLGAKSSNLALVRPTWMPTTLTESLYMLIPEQEAALRDPDFLDRLAAAHVRGIEEFLRGRAAT